jgi:hypothetical protein
MRPVIGSYFGGLCDDRVIKLHIFPWNAAASKAGLLSNTAYIIRPDGHVAIADLSADRVRIASYLDRWLINAGREKCAG